MIANTCRGRLNWIEILALAWGLAGWPAAAADVLFDASHHEMAGNADWIVDADTFNLNLLAFPCSGSTLESNPQRFPTPSSTGINASTPETYWTGAISAWAVDLVKAGHAVETLPPGASITFGDAMNPQDLSQFDLFIVVEPQNPFTATEKSAILGFVQSGGGLFMVADHETSDRDCDGWDSPQVWNDLGGATSASQTGLFGIWFRVDGSDARPSEDWFDEAVNSNVSTDPGDPVIHGPFGSGAGGLGLFGSTSMDLRPADNPTVRGHVWRTGQAHGDLRVTFATASYGSGRVAAIGDSSPADDGTGDTGDSLHLGWDRASGGVANREIHLNACDWLLNGMPDTTPPTIIDPPTVIVRDCTARVEWATDEPSTSVVEYGATPTYGDVAALATLSPSHAVDLAGLSPASNYHFRASSTDAAGNGPTTSGDAVFATVGPAPPLILLGPQVAGSSGSSATLTWTTDEPSDSTVEFGTTPSWGSSVSVPTMVREHAVTVSGLLPETGYHARVLSTDGCGHGPTASADLQFMTGPAAIDVSGWRLQQQGASQSSVLPPGSMIPSGGYLVVARNATRAEFEAFFPSLPAATTFVNSNAGGSCANGCLPQINGGESFELFDLSNTRRDGPTIVIGTDNAYQRTRPGDSSGAPSSWNVVGEASANPGLGAGVASAAGVVINEMADASDYRKEFVELHYDATPVTPDTVAPARVPDLDAAPLGATSVRLTWTASGDDGLVGSATAYDLRHSGARIESPADFAAATAVGGTPVPAASGSAEQFVVQGLQADTAYYFALQVVDEAGNRSTPSAYASAVTGPAGGAAPVPHLVISQVRVSGSSDDVIEFYNPTASAIALAGQSIQYLAANGNFGFKVNLATASVPAHGWYLTAANSYAGSPARDGSLGTNNLSSSAGHALLVSDSVNVSGCSDPQIVDRVGYGASTVCPEGGAGNAATTPTGGLSIARKPGGSAGNGQDTDVNATDFSAPASPVFRSSTNPPAPPVSPLGNVRATLYLAPGVAETELSWARAVGATAYNAYRGTTPDFMGAAPAPWTTVPENDAADAEIPMSLFFYVVRATDGTEESAD